MIARYIPHYNLDLIISVGYRVKSQRGVIFRIVKFVDNGFELEVNVSPEEDTVWLKSEEMARLFGVQRPAVIKHITGIISSGELTDSTCSILEQVQIEGGRSVRRGTKIYNLDMIIAVGYRVNSKRGTIFRQWANKILKQYMLKGYAVEPSRVLVTQENYLSLVNVVNDMKSSQITLEERVEKLQIQISEPALIAIRI